MQSKSQTFAVHFCSTIPWQLNFGSLGGWLEGESRSSHQQSGECILCILKIIIAYLAYCAYYLTYSAYYCQYKTVSSKPAYCQHILHIKLHIILHIIILHIMHIIWHIVHIILHIIMHILHIVFKCIFCISCI